MIFATKKINDRDMHLAARNRGGSPQDPKEYVHHGEFLGAEGRGQVGHHTRGVAYDSAVEHYLTCTASRTPLLIDEYA